MAAPVFVRTADPTTSNDIRAIEREYGFTLPEDYKAHLLRYNGGWPDRDTFLQPDSDAPGRYVARRVSDFKSVRYGTATLEKSLQNLQGDLHDDLVPIASNTGGNLFVLSVGPEDYGSVYYISHEFYVPPFDDQEYDEAADTYEPLPPRHYGQGVHFLAPSFTAFLDGLVESPAID